MLNVFTSYNQLSGCRSGEYLQFDLHRISVNPGRCVIERGARVRVRVRAGRGNNVSKSIQGSKNMCF